jgi:hypothetical protein
VVAELDGPEIVARSISAVRIPDKFGNEWQYQSRSDRHSKIACWTVFYDLMLTSALLRQHVASQKVVFGVNLTMRDFKTQRKKDLDLVIARPRDDAPSAPSETLSTLAVHYGVVLDQGQRARLAGLPVAYRGNVGTVLVALEAKACMTAHVKAKSRLYDELDASHLTVHGASDDAAAAALVMINDADEFLSPGRNQYDLRLKFPTVNKTNDVAAVVGGVIEKVAEVPRRSGTGTVGYDAIGVLVVNCRNDGSRVTVVHGPPAPQAPDDFHYDQMIRRLGHIYDARFKNV